MTRICFEIELDTETGDVMAGVCPQEENTQDDMQRDKDYLQSVSSIGEALGKAHDALMGNQTERMGMMEARGAMKRGYDRVKG